MEGLIHLDSPSRRWTWLPPQGSEGALEDKHKNKTKIQMHRNKTLKKDG